MMPKTPYFIVKYKMYAPKYKYNIFIITNYKGDTFTMLM